jgi:uncharacterized protein DUF922
MAIARVARDPHKCYPDLVDADDSNNAATGRFVPARLAAIMLMAGALVAWAARTSIEVQANPSRLDWSLFRRVDSISGASEDARIAAEMSFPRPLKVERSGTEYRLPSFTIAVAPEPARTMVRRSAVLSEYLLRHEQGHYDIVILAARALARELEAMTAGSAQELSHRAQDCIDKHTSRAKDLSEAYDRETDRSRDPTTQARWTEHIEAALGDPRTANLAGLPL